jgi:hypothetical protein
MPRRDEEEEEDFEDEEDEEDEGDEDDVTEDIGELVEWWRKRKQTKEKLKNRGAESGSKGSRITIKRQKPPERENTSRNKTRTRRLKFG